MPPDQFAIVLEKAAEDAIIDRSSHIPDPPKE